MYTRLDGRIDGELRLRMQINLEEIFGKVDQITEIRRFEASPNK